MQCIEAASKGLEAAIEAAKGHTVDALILSRTTHPELYPMDNYIRHLMCI